MEIYPLDQGFYFFMLLNFMNLRYQNQAEREKICFGDRKTTKFLCIPVCGCYRGKLRSGCYNAQTCTKLPSQNLLYASTDYFLGR